MLATKPIRILLLAVGVAALIALILLVLHRPSLGPVSAAMTELDVADRLLVSTDPQSADIDLVVELTNRIDRALNDGIGSAVSSDPELERPLRELMEVGSERLERADALVASMAEVATSTIRELDQQIAREAESWQPIERAGVEELLAWYRTAIRSGEVDAGELTRIRGIANRSPRLDTALEELLGDVQARRDGLRKSATAFAALREGRSISDAIERSRTRLSALDRPPLVSASLAGALAAVCLIALAFVTPRASTTTAETEARASEPADDALAVEDERIEMMHRLTEQDEEIRRLKESMRQSESDARVATVRELGAGLMHEINTPITYMRTNLNSAAREVRRQGQLLWSAHQFLDLIAGDSDESVIERQLSELVTSLEGADPLAESEAIAQLLHDSQHGIDQIASILRGLDEDSAGEEAPASCTAKEAIDTTLKMLAHRIEAGTEICQRLDDGRELGIGRPELVQVLAVILVNAVEASASVSRIELQVSPSGKGTMFSVKDQGIGMTKEQIARSIEPNFTTKAEGGHRGLGLTLASRILKRSGGRIGIASEPGQGTNVKFWVPIR